MAVKSTGDAAVDALYKVRKGDVEFVDVPELAYVMIDGGGAPGGETFTDALQALYSVSYGVHFALKKSGVAAPRVMPLEGLWWTEGAAASALFERVAAGDRGSYASSRDEWCWRLMIVQLPPVDEVAIARAVDQAKAKKGLASLSDVRFERWAEGPSAQIMHVGPYATEAASVAALHHAIIEHGLRPRGHHHEIYLGDPRTSSPENLRTILRQPVEPIPLHEPTGRTIRSAGRGRSSAG